MPIPDGNDASIFKISKRSCRKTLQMCLDIPLEFLNADPVVILGHAKIGMTRDSGVVTKHDVEEFDPSRSAVTSESTVSSTSRVRVPSLVTR